MSDVSNNDASMDKKIVLVEIDGVREEKELVEKNNGFDAQTGEPVVSVQVQTGFDAQTGEAVYSDVVQDGFDAETGKPVYKIKKENSAAAFMKSAGDAVSSVAANVANEAKSASKNKALIPIIAIVVAAILVVGIIVAIIKGGLFMNNMDKIASASAKTLADDTICGTLVEASKIMYAEEATYTVKGSANVEGMNADIDATIAQNINKGQMMMDATVDVSGITEQQIQFYYDDTKIQFAAPDIISQVFEYNYRAKNDGYLAEVLEDEEDIDIDDFNAMLVAASDIYKSSPKFRKEFASEMAKVYKNFDVKKAETQVFEVDGKDVKCKGYTMVIDEDDVEAIFEAYINTIDKVYGESFKEFCDVAGEVSGEDMDYEEMIDEMREELDDLEEDEVEINFYIYKGMLAAIEAEGDDDEISIQFQGGDTRTANMKIVVKTDGDKVVIKRKSTVDGTKEKGSVSTSGVDLFDYSYDTKTGKFEVEPSFGSSVSGVFKVESGKKVTIECDGRIEDTSLDLTIEVTQGAKIKELTGKIFDLGTADEDDFEDLVEDLEDEMGSLMYMF